MKLLKSQTVATEKSGTKWHKLTILGVYTTAFLGLVMMQSTCYAEESGTVNLSSTIVGN